jgi:hypothetical protein
MKKLTGNGSGSPALPCSPSSTPETDAIAGDPNTSWNRKASDLARLAEKLERERDELQQTLSMVWDADIRAIEKWRESNPGSELVMPDRAALVEWLLEKADMSNQLRK